MPETDKYCLYTTNIYTTTPPPPPPTRRPNHHYHHPTPHTRTNTHTSLYERQRHHGNRRQSQDHNQLLKYSTSISMKLQRALDLFTLSRNVDQNDTFNLRLRYMMTTATLWQYKYYCTQGQSFDHVRITPNDVKSCIVNLDSEKFSGHEGIPDKHFKICTDFLFIITSELINMSIDECAFPDRLKYAEIAAMDYANRIIDQRPLLFFIVCHW